MNHALFEGGPDQGSSWFALLRHDQLEELKQLLGQGGALADFDRLKNALAEIGDQLENSDWHQYDGDNDFRQRFQGLVESDRFDFGRVVYGHLEFVPNEPPEDIPLAGADEPGREFLVLTPGAAPPAEVHGAGWTAHGDGLLRFRQVVDG